MLFSTSSVKGEANFGDPRHFLKRQLVWLAVAVCAAGIVARFDYHWWKKLWWPLAAVSLTMLCLVFVPGIRLRAGGSFRWIHLGPLSFQPSELAKFTMVIGMSAWMSHVGRHSSTFKRGLLWPILGLGAMVGLLFLEPDFGTAVLTALVGFLIMFAAGTRVSHLAVTAMLGFSGFILMVMHDSLRMGRVLAFLMPEKYPDKAYHLGQSKVAFIRGGWSGVGLGNSLQKQFYLPEAHTDFILAIIGEELGLLATLSVLLLFAGLFLCGMYIATRAPDPFGRLLGFGLTAMLTVQACINIGVVTGCLPTKGLPLPFISYGGSSLLMSVVSVAVLLNIAKHSVPRQPDDHTRSIRDKAHRF